MTHPGLPIDMAIIIVIGMVVLSGWSLLTTTTTTKVSPGLSLARLPKIGYLFQYLTRHTWPLLVLKIVFALVFILIISAGLWGSPIAERNLATSLTWNLWWTGIIIAVLFSGSAWCAVCPWDNIANWLVNHRLWGRSDSKNSLRLRVPELLRSVWPASLLFVSFTWLEMGVGIVTSPYATALLAVAMVVLATSALALFEGKAFCRYMCPVGRTIGAYSQLAPVALRPIDPDICRQCTTLECYHGSETIAPCPTKLVMGRLQENTYCTSCGNCTQSCPSSNINWQIRSPGSEAIIVARPHMDEAFFMLILLSLTLFHGLTMLENWQSNISVLAQAINDSGRLLVSFTMGMTVSMAVPIVLYSLAVWLTVMLCTEQTNSSFKKVFSGFAFVSLPLAFTYHIAHNLNHFIRERNNWIDLIANPFNNNASPLSLIEKHNRFSSIMLPEYVLFGLQGILISAGFFIAVQVIRHRGYQLMTARGIQLLPMLLFAGLITTFNLWMLVQPMTMRM